MSSLSLGRILMTSPLRVFTTILLPTASSTSIDSVFLRRKNGRERERRRVEGGRGRRKEKQEEDNWAFKVG